MYPNAVQRWKKEHIFYSLFVEKKRTAGYLRDLVRKISDLEMSSRYFGGDGMLPVINFFPALFP